VAREEARELYNQGKTIEAMEQFMLEDVDPSNDPELAYYFGLCHTRLGEYETALDYFQRVLEIDFHILRTFQTRMVVSYIFNTTEQYKLAIHQLELLLEDGFESSQIYSSLGYSHWCMGNTEESIDYYQKALEQNPEHQTSLNALGYIMADKGLRVDEAMGYCQKALSLDPLNPNYLDSLGWACFKAGRYKEALEYLQRACEREDADELIFTHLQKVKQSI